MPVMRCHTATHLAVLGHIEAHVGDVGLSGGARVAWRSVHVLCAVRLCKLPHQRVLPAAAAYNQHIDLRMVEVDSSGVCWGTAR